MQGSAAMSIYEFRPTFQRLYLGMATGSVRTLSSRKALRSENSCVIASFESWRQVSLGPGSMEYHVEILEENHRLQ